MKIKVVNRSKHELLNYSTIASYWDGLTTDLENPIVLKR